MPNVTGTGNRILTPDDIVTGALKILKNNLVFAPTVYRDLESNFAAKRGDTISIKLPPRVRATDGRVLQSNEDGINDKYESISIDYQKHISFNVTMKDLSLALDKFLKRYVEAGVKQLANAVDLSIANTIKSAGYYSSQTETSSTELNQEALLKAAAYQDMVGVPDDGRRFGILNPLDGAALGNSLANLSQQQFTNKALMSRWVGTVGGYNLFKSQNVLTHTNGLSSSATLTVSTPPDEGDNYLGLTCNEDGTLYAGTVLTFSGVYEINPQNYTSTGRLARFVVTEDVTFTAGSSTLVYLSPYFNTGSLTTTDSEGNTVNEGAYQTVTALPTTSSTVTIIGGGGNTYRQNLLYHKEAVALAMVSIEKPWHANNSAVARDEETGITISLTGSYDVTNHADITRLDVIWGVKAIRPELIHRLYTVTV